MCPYKYLKHHNRIASEVLFYRFTTAQSFDNEWIYCLPGFTAASASRRVYNSLIRTRETPVRVWSAITPSFSIKRHSTVNQRDDFRVHYDFMSIRAAMEQ